MSITVSIPDRDAYVADEAVPDTRRGQDVAVAAYHTAHRHPGKIRRVAELMDVNVGTLTAKVNLQNDTHHLTLAEAVTMQDVTGDHAILHAMAERLGYTCTRVTPDQSAGDPIEATARMDVAYADLKRALADGVLMGAAGVTPNAMRRALHVGDEAIGTISHALAMLRGRMRRAPEAGQ